MKRDLLLELGIAESRAAEATAAEHLGEALRLSATPAARAQVAQELAGFFNVFGRFGESAAVRERAIGECSDREAELRFSLETEAAVLAVTSMPARRRLGSLMARLRAEAEVMTGDRVAAPLLAVLAEELAETDGRAAEVIAYAEFAFADDRLFTRDGAAPGIGAAALVLADQPMRAEAILDAAIPAAHLRGSIMLFVSPTHAGRSRATGVGVSPRPRPTQGLRSSCPQHSRRIQCDRSRSPGSRRR
jgi:hypothetical protein